MRKTKEGSRLENAVYVMPKVCAYICRTEFCKNRKITGNLKV